jgi:hypothetical protein
MRQQSKLNNEHTDISTAPDMSHFKNSINENTAIADSSIEAVNTLEQV